MSIDRPTYRLRIRALPDVDEIRALKELLKRMKRQFGFQCLEASEEDGTPFAFEDAPDAPASEKPVKRKGRKK